MATSAGPLEGDALPAAVSDAMSELHQRYYRIGRDLKIELFFLAAP
jgi:hypothetical protein